jgi:hypothetical protein
MTLSTASQSALSRRSRCGAVYATARPSARASERTGLTGGFESEFVRFKMIAF